jgi:hypothetical protein
MHSTGGYDKLKSKEIDMSRELCCSQCGAPGTGTCDCNAPYVPLLEYIAKYMDPDLSSRINAKKLGVSKDTVLRARNQLAQNAPIAPDAKVTTLNNKQYPARPKRNKKREAKHSKEVDKLLNKACDFFTGFCHKITDDRWAKALTPDERAEYIKFLHTAANHFTLIAQELSSLNTPPQTEEPSPWQVNDTTSVRTGPSFH